MITIKPNKGGKDAPPKEGERKGPKEDRVQEKKGKK
jgi:hypothetical protein